MGNLIDEQGKIDRELVGPAITVGGHLVQPVARMAGRGQGSGAGVQITPVKVMVLGPDGQERTVPIFDLTSQALQGILGAGLGIAAVCGLLILLRKIT